MNCRAVNVRKLTGVLIIVSACGGAFGAEVAVLPEVVVAESRAREFRGNSVEGATGSSIPAEESPQSVDVMTRDLLDARNVVDLDQAMEYDSSVSTGGATLYSRTAGQYSIRGFSGSDVLVQGMPLPSGMGTLLDTAVVEKIEVVKGPIGSLSGGQSSALGPYGAGGSVVLQLRQPQMDDFTDLSTFARFSRGGQQYRTVIDANRHIKSDSESVKAMRTIVTGEYERPFWQNGGKGGQAYMVAPSFMIQPDKRTKFVITSVFQYQDRPAYQGVPVLGGHFVGPYDSWIGGPASRSLYRSAMLQAHGEWKQEKVWTIRAGIGGGVTDVDYNMWALSSGSPTKGVSALNYYNSIIETGMGNYEYSWSDMTYATWNSYVQGLAKFSAGDVKHEALIWLDYVGRNQAGYSSFDTTSQRFHLANPERPTEGTRVHDGNESELTMQRVGMTLQEMATINQWRVLIGLRMDEQFSDRGKSAFSLSPRAGVSKTLWERLVLFGNVSSTEAPNFGYKGEDGQELTSSWRAVQYETGARVNVADSLWLNTSWFMIDQQNTPESSPQDKNLYITNGKSRSKGVELSMNGKMSDAWSSYLSYTYLNYRDMDQHLSFDRYAPHTVALWQEYRVNGGLLSGATIGVGFRFKAKYFATLRGNKIADNYTIPESHVFDLVMEVPLQGAGWMKDCRVRFAIYNLFDEQFVASSRHAVQCFAGEPRTFEICVKKNF